MESNLCIYTRKESRFITRVDAVAIGDLRERYTAPHISLFIIMYVKRCVIKLRMRKMMGNFWAISMPDFSPMPGFSSYHSLDIVLVMK